MYFDILKGMKVTPARSMKMDWIESPEEYSLERQPEVLPTVSSVSSNLKPKMHNILYLVLSTPQNPNCSP